MMNSTSIQKTMTSRRDCRAMTLIIAMLFMSFVVLLILSLSTLVEVETRLSASHSQQLQAQSNALLGLNVALGELQQALGPDRRVSATADILTEAQPHQGRNVPVDVTQNYWTGVWNAEGALRNWLVSGNESTEEASDLFEDASPSFTPDAVLEDVSVAMDAGGRVSVGGSDALVLVANGSAGTLDEDAMVVAPAVSIDGSGAYAWWVGDEGVKARLNTVDRYVVDGEPGATARHLSAQRNAIELMSNLGEYDTLDGEELDKFSSVDQLRLSLPDLTDAQAQAHFHDLTLWSKGLLVDVRNGGLKRDLTHLFELGVNEGDDSDFLSELPQLYSDVLDPVTGDPVVLAHDDEGTTPIAQMAVTTPDWYFDANPELDAANFQPWTLMGLPFGPTWEQLRSFYRLEDSVDVINNSISIRPQREDQAGVYPILLQARVFTGISRVMTGPGVDSMSDTDDDEMEVFAHFRIMFLLANPYAVDLDIGDMNLTFYMRGGAIPICKLDEAGKNVFDRIVYDGEGEIVYENGDIVYDEEGEIVYDEEGEIVYEQDIVYEGAVFGRWTSLFNQQRFHIASGTKIPAGEARIFTLDRSGADTSASPAYPTFTISDSNFSSYSDQPEIVTHELINDYDELVSLRCQLPGGPYTRLETDNAYLEAGSPGGSDGVVLTWAPNPTDYRDVLQFSGSIGSGNMDNDFGGDRFSDYLDPFAPDGQVFWGGGSRWMMTDASKAGAWIGNHIREVTIRAPYRNPNSDPYNPSQSITGGQRFPSISSGVTRSKKFGATELLFEDTTTNLPRAGWGMLYAPWDGQSPYFVNQWFYIPSSEAPVNSLGQLQHFNASGYIPTEPASTVYDMDYTWARHYYNTVYALTKSGVGYDDFPTMAFNDEYAIGNSFSSRYVERDRVYQGDSVLFPRDASWLLNAALWDRFYFSTMPQSGSFDLSEDKLLNNRYQPLDEGTPPSADTLRSSTTAFAEQMGVIGGFNVNSTSTEAWKAFLAGTLGVSYQGETHADEAVFARTPQQDAGSRAGNSADDTILSESAWKGYRTLTGAEIGLLAEQIVYQVKLRGPFLSLAHFVNRLPIAADDDDYGIGIKGALQAAIDAADLNSLSAAAATHPSLLSNNAPSVAVDLEHGYDSLISGGPGQITQGDLLQPLAPYLSARSDTFKIRSTGTVKDPVTGATVSQVWCEAVVQRLPEYVDDSQLPTSTIAELSANAVNHKLGRRFVVVAFRWLDQNEI